MMTKSPFKDPHTETPLYWSVVGEELITKEGEVRCVGKAGVFRLLPKRTQASATEAGFDYQDHYQKDAEEFDYFAGWEDPAAVHENQRLHEMILAQAPTSITRVLDVGCGAAWVAAHFKTTDTEVYSMDISTVNPEKAVAKYPFPRHYGVVADVFQLPFQENSFDLIVASEIIEHVADPAVFLARLLPALALGGVLVVTTPHDEKLAYSLCIHCNQSTPHHAHLHSFTADSIRGLLPAELQTGARTKTFMNKFLLHGRTHPLLKHLPFAVWRLVDGVANLFLRKTARLMLVVRRDGVS